MCNFNELDDTAKTLHHDTLSRYAASVGGANAFLQILESIRKTKPHPLQSKNCEFRFASGSIKWTKVIFEDKLTLLQKVRVGESKRGNLLPEKSDKSYKNVLNLIRTLAPITFTVKPKNSKDGEGFTLTPFEIIDENTTRLSPLFDALFFCSIETVKKVLSYEPKREQ